MMPRLFFQFCIVVAMTFAVSACFSVSDHDQLLSSSGEIRTDDPQCLAEAAAPDVNNALDASGFSIVSWNIFKGNKTGWMRDLSALTAASDLVLLQEAYLTQALSQLLETSGQEWEMISAFRYQGIHAGVMTMGAISPQASCGQRVNEPLVLLPKSALISYFPIRKRQQTLLVANIHAINFTPGIERFTEQLLEIKAVLAQHNGPVVFAGDFNTWSEQRQGVLNQLTEQLDLKKVEFSGASPVLFLGHHLDHVFFKNLKVLKAEVIAVNSSDHKPLQVHFEFAPDYLAANLI